MNKPIPDYPVAHAGLKPVQHPRLGVTVNAQTAVRYLRFLRPVRVDRLDLPFHTYGRWVPKVPTHPAHLILSLLDRGALRWETVREFELPLNERILGKGLCQRMPIEKMEAHFEKVMKSPPRRFALKGLRTDHLRVECDREHPVWPNHGECNGGIFGVPFGSLDPLKAFGQASGKDLPEPAYQPVLNRERIRPRAPRGMKMVLKPYTLTFEGEKLSVGFSLARPLLTHLGWDASGGGRGNVNRLVASRDGSRRWLFKTIGGPSGPSFRTLEYDGFAYQWTGTVAVEGNRVRYGNLRLHDGIRIDAVFTVLTDRLLLELIQSAPREVPVLEAEVWRLLWTLEHQMTSAVACPTLRPGRNGDIELPAFIAGDGVGGLSCRILAGDRRKIQMQVESSRQWRGRSCGFVLAPFPEAGRPIVIPAGRQQAVFELAVTDLAPRDAANLKRLSPGLLCACSAVLTAFRPELGGFSNNAVSVNCHVNQHVAADWVPFIRKPKEGPDPVELARFTIERALLDGGGYGYHRNLYLDSDPILLSGAGRLHQLAPSRAWLERVRPAILETANRILENIGREGLVICRDLSGNSGSYRWSSNAMDCVGFGHIDAYVNAWSYRALRNAAALLGELRETALTERCRERAAALREAYPKYLVNPATGWVAGWRSRDGQLHDYAFVWINGPACAFGLLESQAARKALAGLERLRARVGFRSAYIGVPFNLLPTKPEDHIFARVFHEMLPSEPTFENYTDGSAGTCGAGYYLRALAIHGLKEQARKLAAEFDQGYADGCGCGGLQDGLEFKTWDGLNSGYEGTFGPSFSPLYAMAIQQGGLIPPEPEWWPAGG